MDTSMDYETIPDADGIKYVVKYGVNEHGQRIRITRKVRVTKTVKRVPLAVVERKARWKKFGKAATTSSLDSAISYRGEEVFLVLGGEEQKEKDRIAAETKFKQKLESEFQNSSDVPTKETETYVLPHKRSEKKSGINLTNESDPINKSNIYVPPQSNLYIAPHKKSENKSNPDDTTCLRISNLSEDTTDDDLRALFDKFGNIQRIHVAKDKKTNLSRGFAFITYYSRTDAQTAFTAMNGRGIDYTIINIDWARPSVR